MNIKYLMLIASFLAYTNQITPTIPLSRALLCVKNQHATPIIFSNFMQSKSINRANPANPYITLQPNEIYARFVSPFYFRSNIAYDTIYVQFGTVPGSLFTQTTNPPALYGIFKNAEAFKTAMPYTTELYRCSIKDADNGVAQCSIDSKFSVAPKQTPQDVCNNAQYP